MGITTEDYNTFVKDYWRRNQEDIEGLFIMTAGLAGETGEVMEHLKKSVRDNTLDKQELKLELGDVLYYLTRISQRFGFTLKDIMQANVDKLTQRKEHGKHPDFRR